MNYIAVITGTALIIIFSWFLSIKYKRYHGIARFFAFESIYILVLFNLKVWFTNPFSLLQIISWILLIFSAYVVITGYLLLKRKGNPDANFENTSVLVKSGIYGYIRHPLYLSVFLLGTGVMLKDPGLSKKPSRLSKEGILHKYHFTHYSIILLFYLMSIGNHVYYIYFVQYLYSVSLNWRFLISSRLAGLHSE